MTVHIFPVRLAGKKAIDGADAGGE